MILYKELTIKEILDEMKVLKGRLIKLADKHNRLLINVSAINWKDIVVVGGRKDDTMLNKMISKENTTDEFDMVLESYNSYKEQAIDKMRNMIQNEPTEKCIVFFRDELHWKWKDIQKMFSYSPRQCHRLYDKGKNGT